MNGRASCQRIWQLAFFLPDPERNSPVGPEKGGESRFEKGPSLSWEDEEREKCIESG